MRRRRRRPSRKGRMRLIYETLQRRMSGRETSRAARWARARAAPSAQLHEGRRESCESSLHRPLLGTAQATRALSVLFLLTPARAAGNHMGFLLATSSATAAFSTALRALCRERALHPRGCRHDASPPRHQGARLTRAAVARASSSRVRRLPARQRRHTSPSPLCARLHRPRRASVSPLPRLSARVSVSARIKPLCPPLRSGSCRRGRTASRRSTFTRPSRGCSPPCTTATSLSGTTRRRGWSSRLRCRRTSRCGRPSLWRGSSGSSLAPTTCRSACTTTTRSKRSRRARPPAAEGRVRLSARRKTLRGADSSAGTRTSLLHRLSSPHSQVFEAHSDYIRCIAVHPSQAQQPRRCRPPPSTSLLALSVAARP